MVDIESLRKLAASEYAWSDGRVATYREDGAPLPEPIRRLHELSKAVLGTLPEDAAISDFDVQKYRGGLLAARTGLYDLAREIERINAELDMHGCERTALVRPEVRDGDVHDDVRRVREGSSGARGRLADDVRVRVPDVAGGVLANVRDEGAAEAGERDRGGSKGADPASAPGARGRDATVAASAPRGARDGAAEGRWPARGLFHGLVLVHRVTGERRLFSEPLQGQWAVQSVAADGLTAGDAWSTMPDAWPVDTWQESPPLPIKPALRRYDEELRAKPAPKAPAEARTLALPGMTDVRRKTLADFTPPASQFATWAGALAKSAGKPVDEARVRELFDAWKAAHADEEKPNPAAAFWQHARSVIVGPTP